MGTSNLRTAPSGRCASCRRQSARLELDHVRPLWDGGANDTSNLQWLCVPCHRAKTARELTSPAYRFYRERQRFRPGGTVRRKRGCGQWIVFLSMIALVVYILINLIG